MSPKTLTRALPGRTLGALTLDRLALGAVFVLAILMRFPGLASKPGYDWDEPVYANIGASVANGDGLHLKADFGSQTVPYLYHPPFYFWLLGGWMRVFGTGIGPARFLAATMSIAVLALLFSLMRRRWGNLALIPLIVLATDGWLVFSNRVSWIENTMLVFAAAAIVVYDLALRSHRTRTYALAGLLVGATVIFKHVGIYVLMAVCITFVVVRRDVRGHLTLLAVALAVIAAYIAGMTLAFQDGTHNWFLDASQVQIERLTGHKESRGSISGLDQVVDAFIGPYIVFTMTLLLAGVSLLMVARRSLILVRRRFATDAVPDPVLYGWAAAAAITFAASGLKMAHYFMMVEIPLLLFLFSELMALKGERGLTFKWANIGIAAMVVILTANLVTFDLRFASRSDNALGQVRDYAASTLPADSLILTEETIGAIVPQPYCKFYKTRLCASRAQYVITYTSRTQAPPDDPRLKDLIARSAPIKVFKGFKETITVYATPN
ncbi:ArnT family glycosyltransferase [Solirubrobacter soli]|uniref:ArnT family glycosyltransferase n=1 Tax=Solirubrobacter soli TaxID=363832 RepID=UPI000414F6F7|nr:glycosyltransferase family 39 protein [Solirubrobacter soli]